MSGARSSETGARQLVEGWIFDVYPSHDGMIVWVIDDHGHPHRLRYQYAPTLYVAGGRSTLAAAQQALARLRIPVTLTPMARRAPLGGGHPPRFRAARPPALASPPARPPR